MFAFLPLLLFVVSPAQADYSPNFTATNVVFNLSNYHLEFDYSGAPFTDSQIFSFDLRNVNADTTGLWWRSTSGTTITCSNNHCSGNLTGIVNPSYPSPYPTASQQMVLQVYINSTSTEYFSQSFTYSSTGGYVCLTGSPSSGYSPTFTASNIVFTPATKKLSFDYPGAPFTDSQVQSFDLRNIDAATSGLWWRSTSGTSITCSNNHCEGFLTGAVNGSYPTLWPTDPQTMVIDVYTGNEEFSQGFTFGSIWQGGACFIPPNQPPQVNSFQGATINEGATYSASGSFTDTDSASWSATVNYGDGAGAQPLTLNPDKTFSLSHLYKDNGTYTVTVSVTDNQGATGTGSATVTVNNVAPTVGAITASINPVMINTSTAASANFTDAGVLDTHTASWNWGDGNTTTGTVTESNGSGSVSDSHAYAAAGVYTITLTITDNNNASSSSVFQFLTVYDTAAGWVSGGKEYTSPAGAVIGNAGATGKADFGFTAKYVNGSPVAIGNQWASLIFKVGNTTYVDFNATAYESLVVTGSKAILRGTGTLNGVSGYSLLISAIEGATSDFVRYQIKDSSGNIVYDTQQGASDTADPTTVVTKGKIDVH
ncbi:MAG TPA: PKD domain-containing protein [Nitrososphaeraceae archaeon]|nr:PKD domain-containing protein [Nitrososphaeraceae archaeon]